MALHLEEGLEEVQGQHLAQEAVVVVAAAHPVVLVSFSTALKYA